MENDIEKGDVDIFRDIFVWYLGIDLFYMFILLLVDVVCMLLFLELFYVYDFCKLFYVYDFCKSVWGRGWICNYKIILFFVFLGYINEVGEVFRV